MYCYLLFTFLRQDSVGGSEIQIIFIVVCSVTVENENETSVGGCLPLVDKFYIKREKCFEFC